MPIIVIEYCRDQDTYTKLNYCKMILKKRRDSLPFFGIRIVSKTQKQSQKAYLCLNFIVWIFSKFPK
jgi:hypothetical protein